MNTHEYKHKEIGNQRKRSLKRIVSAKGCWIEEVEESEQDPKLVCHYCGRVATEAYVFDDGEALYWRLYDGDEYAVNVHGAIYVCDDCCVTEDDAQRVIQANAKS